MLSGEAKIILPRPRKKFSRSEWVSKLLGLERPARTSTEPGILLIQIDGLSYNQLKEGLRKNRLPFLKKLLDSRQLLSKPFYSGMPSSTPAVQAELFFGVKSGVPAFQFVERDRWEDCAMYYSDCVNRTAERLAAQHQGLLAGGTCYANTFTGGANEARYCTQTLDIVSLVKAAHPLKILMVVIFHLGKFLRILGLALIELGLALIDFFRGITGKQDFFKELKFVPTRVGVCIVLRELVRFRVKLDVLRGVPIIHANFVGYDEQAHRRGPSSGFAHWTLQGIDGAIKDIYRSALRSEYRRYRLIVYSDHGQEGVRAYETMYGKSLHAALQEVFSQGLLSRYPVEQPHSILAGIYLYHRGRSLLLQEKDENPRGAAGSGAKKEIKFAAMGPLGHIYVPHHISPEEKVGYARRLAVQAHIPLVLFAHRGEVTAVHSSGDLLSLREAEQILGEDHPFSMVVAEDLERVCLHPDAGDFVISGWQPKKQPMSFQMENGGHGGPGTEETRGFVLLPPSVADKQTFLRPADLREKVLALAALNRRGESRNGN